jgi:hypothetical protein
VRRVRQRAMLNAAADPSIPMIVERSSTLARPAEEVWAEVTTPSGINWELRPWLRMTVPRRFRTLSLQDVELGALVCRSWVLLLGLVPFEYDDLVLVERGPRLRFLELSSTLATRMWQHERVVEPSAPVAHSPTGCPSRFGPASVACRGSRRRTGAPCK